MGAGAAKQTISDFIETVWRRGDLDALERYWSEDCRNHAAPAGHQDGLEALRRYHESFSASFADFADSSTEIVQQIAEDDIVVTRILTSAVHTPSQRPVQLESIRIDRLRDGRIAEHWTVADFAGLQAQLAG